MFKRFWFNRLRRRRERFPRLLSIELCSMCNASCIMCPHDQMLRPKQPMPLDLLARIVHQCQGQPLQKLNLFWMGESFCHRQLLDALRLVRRGLPDVRLYISTNAGLLDEVHSRAIIDEDLLDVINFDIDGITKETYQEVRHRVDFDVVMRNIGYFLDYKRRQRRRNPQTRVTIIRMPETEAEIDRFVAHWRPQVDRVEVNDYNTWLGSQEDRNLGDVAVRSQQGRFDFACQHPWDELVIAADGTAGLCCLDYDLRAPLGNVRDASIAEIWNGDQLRRYRQRMLAGRYDQLAVCKDCNAFIFQHRSLWARLQR
jgi:MoaA/NifB/PqqE/SkfB family radical SAM enzyme